jgi:hypothetical protein
MAKISYRYDKVKKKFVICINISVGQLTQSAELELLSVQLQSSDLQECFTIFLEWSRKIIAYHERIAAGETKSSASEVIRIASQYIQTIN